MFRVGEVPALGAPCVSERRTRAPRLGQEVGEERGGRHRRRDGHLRGCEVVATRLAARLSGRHVDVAHRTQGRPPDPSEGSTISTATASTATAPVVRYTHVRVADPDSEEIAAPWQESSDEGAADQDPPLDR